MLLEKLKQSPDHIILYGAGPIAELLLRVLKRENLEPTYICDNNPKKIGTDFYGYSIVSSQILQPDDQPYLLITPMKGVQELIQEYQKQGFFYVFEVSELLEEYHFGEGLSSQDAYLQYCKKIYLAYSKPNSADKISLRYMALSITEWCNLRCRKCANLMTYFKKPQHYTLKRILTSMERLCDSIDEIITVSLIGGEPFLYPHLEEVIAYIAKRQEIKTILLITNGTILPSQSLLRCMKQYQVAIQISNYGEVSKKCAEISALLEQYGIAYTLPHTFYWNDLGDLQCRNRNEEALKALYKKCDQRYEWSLADSRFSCCGRASSGELIGTFEQKDDEVIDLLDMQKDRAHLRENITSLLHKRFFTACNYCDGQMIDGAKIPPAEQETSI